MKTMMRERGGAHADVRRHVRVIGSQLTARNGFTSQNRNCTTRRDVSLTRPVETKPTSSQFSFTPSLSFSLAIIIVFYFYYSTTGP